MEKFTEAPALEVERWFNAETPPSLDALRGRVVVIECFQMLCPGCVSHGLPQAMRIRFEFERLGVAVLGLHTVFENHEAMKPHALAVFLKEYRIDFPVGVDAPGESTAIPKTMEAYRTRGTPTLILIDRFGRFRAQHFGQVSDLQIGAEIMALQMESPAEGHEG